MFVIVQCWYNLSEEEKVGKSLHEQIGETMKHAGVAITVTSITDVFAFGIGAVTVSKYGNMGFKFPKEGYQISYIWLNITVTDVFAFCCYGKNHNDLLFERSIFQTFWTDDCCAKFLLFELETSNFDYLLIYDFL